MPLERRRGRNPNPVKIAAAGVVAGIVSGLLGIGGGVVMVPLLVLLAGRTQHEAHATSLGAIVPIGLVGAAAFAFDGRVSFAAAAGLAAGALAGAPLGAAVMAKASERSLRAAFGLLTVGVGIVMVVT